MTPPLLTVHPQLLGALLEQRRHWHALAQLEQTFGLTAAQVQAALLSYHAFGYPLEFREREVLLHEPPDFWTTDEIVGRLSKPALWRTQLLAEVTSTNDLARAQAREGVPAGLVIAAARQTQGRGRLGRSWESPSGAGLYVSLLLRPHISAENLGELVLRSSVAIRDAVLEISGISAQIKWPNDLVVGDRKLSGLLIETEVEQQQVACAILGIGINLHQAHSDFSPLVADRATSLFLLTGQKFRRADLLVALLRAMTMRLEQPIATCLELARSHSATLGQIVRIQTGHSLREGMAEALDETGALLLRRSSGFLERITMGEVQAI